MLPYRSIEYSSDCDETFTSCWKYAGGGFGNLRKLKIILAEVSCVALHSDLGDIWHTWLQNKRKIIICMTIPLYHPYYLGYPVF